MISGMPKLLQRCLNSVARSPARTVLRYGKSAPVFGRGARISSTSFPKRICGGCWPLQRVFIRKKLMT